MEEHHHVQGDMSTLKFLGVTLLNILITLAELIGGLLSGSLSLISDAFHNMEDTVSIVLAFVTHLIAKKSNDERQTFGYKRAEILAAFINAVVLIVITVLLIIESIKRLGKVQAINGNMMLVVAIIGLAANLISMLLMMQGARNNLNIKATFLHMASDTLSSVGVIVAAILIKLFGWYWADPVITILTAAWIMKASLEVLKQAVSILMEASPNLDLHAICATILQIPEVSSVHHVHLWRIDEELIAFDAHINIKDNINVSELELLYQQIGTLLKTQYGIGHVTLQAEYKRGLQEKLLADRRQGSSE
ncbi:cation diffusion facilitator family transporter [Bombilactobacillus thymidiniphilus]|uniref:Cation diffusion facilitator family transporter n=1 Tax=Bombilactobacillus thymidiniphilus TaxID=2923363 RepID=A0ABY4PEB0_9LACO|nr:cation diffusion facilitator family transporter [Bombilactobacillus thymidiniphilus]UQS83965.1 cation diffusion facilitator family transporter [Bombilactobacillus thymidiniphilus]